MSFAERAAMEKREAERRAPMVVLSGDIGEAIIPDYPGVLSRRWADKKHLWVTNGSSRSEIKHGGVPISISEIEPQTLALR